MKNNILESNSNHVAVEINYAKENVYIVTYFVTYFGGFMRFCYIANGTYIYVD